MSSSKTGISDESQEVACFRNCTRNLWVETLSLLCQRKTMVRQAHHDAPKIHVVSLIASSTEIVCSLGCGNLLVGRSHECDFPAWIKKLPVCTEPKFPVEGSSYDIDQRVKAILQEGLSVYRVHGETLRKLKPDVIITQIQCEVCAVSKKDVEEAVCEWTGGRPEVVSLEPNALADFWEDVRKVAKALHVVDRGEKLIADLKKRMSDIQKKAALLKPKPTVACIEWIDPLMASGNWTPEIVSMAGGVNLFGVAGKHSPTMTWDEVVAKDPDVIFVNPCGFDIPRTLQEMPILKAKPGWKKLKAVKNGRVIVADGNQFFNRPGPRLVESLEILAEVFHPKHFSFGHEGNGWVKHPSS